MKNHLAIAITILSCTGIFAADPFTFDAPRDWRRERIPFPLGFAPELKYKGSEELRFGPGMFKPGSETYWTYVFFWWVEGKPQFTKATLEQDLIAYYDGLSKAVGKSKGLKIDPEKITAKLRPAITTANPSPIHGPVFNGTMTTYDAFATGKLLKLHVEISQHHFETADRTWVWFSVSPKDPKDHANISVWRQMTKIKRSFKLK